MCPEWQLVKWEGKEKKDAKDDLQVYGLGAAGEAQASPASLALVAIGASP